MRKTFNYDTAVHWNFNSSTKIVAILCNFLFVDENVCNFLNSSTNFCINDNAERTFQKKLCTSVSFFPRICVVEKDTRLWKFKLFDNQKFVDVKRRMCDKAIRLILRYDILLSKNTDNGANEFLSATSNVVYVMHGLIRR